MRLLSILLSLGLLLATAGCCKKTNPRQEPADPMGTAPQDEPSTDPFDRMGSNPQPFPIDSGSTPDAGGTTGRGSGNVTVEPVAREQPIPALPAEPEPTIHVVQRGDTMYGIAQKYYGSGLKWTVIRDANPGVDPNKMAVGTKLTIPPK